MNSLKKNLQSGFTFVELVLVMGIIAILLGFATINLLAAHNTSSFTAVFDRLVSDMRSQQVKAMVGDTEGRNTTDVYGIHFDSNQYVLFHGPVYNTADPTNFIVALDPNLSFSSIGLPLGNVIFQNASGDVSGFSQPQSTVTLQTLNNTKTMTINKYGVIVSAN